MDTAQTELQNALAFYTPAPESWFEGMARRVEATGEWIWQTLQGDFNDDQTTAQVVTGTIISMIPLVDQICDIRDLIANGKKVKDTNGDTGAWIAVALTLIGLVPVLGSLAKGALKLVFRKIGGAFSKAMNKDRLIAAGINDGLKLLDNYLEIPAVQKTLKWMKISNAYHYLEDEVRALIKIADISLLKKQLDGLLYSTEILLDKAKRWGPKKIREPVEQLWQQLTELRNMADEGLSKSLGPVHESLEKLANRLHIEGDNAYRAYVGPNAHIYGGQRALREKEFLEKERPDWVDIGKEQISNKPLRNLSKRNYIYIDRGWPDLSLTSKKSALRGKFDTFDSSMAPVQIPPGEKLYRVVDPSSSDNNICWMRESEFSQLTSKSDWRRRFAVWKSWNENGEYVIYTVPPGNPLKVWEGRAGTQLHELDKKISLEGGGVQIVLDPSQLDKGYSSARLKTGWGYKDFTNDPVSPYVGLPDLMNKWYGN